MSRDPQQEGRVLTMDSQQKDRGLTRSHLQGDWNMTGGEWTNPGVLQEEGQELIIPLPGEPGSFAGYLLNQIAPLALT